MLPSTSEVHTLNDRYSMHAYSLKATDGILSILLLIKSFLIFFFKIFLIIQITRRIDRIPYLALGLEPRGVHLCKNLC